MTVDGGATWHERSAPPAGTTQVRFATTQLGYAFGQVLSLTKDGGRTWSHPWAEPLVDLAFGDQQVLAARPVGSSLAQLVTSPVGTASFSAVPGVVVARRSAADLRPVSLSAGASHGTAGLFAGAGPTVFTQTGGSGWFPAVACPTSRPDLLTGGGPFVAIVACTADSTTSEYELGGADYDPALGKAAGPATFERLSDAQPAGRVQVLPAGELQQFAGLERGGRLVVEALFGSSRDRLTRAAQGGRWEQVERVGSAGEAALVVGGRDPALYLSADQGDHFRRVTFASVLPPRCASRQLVAAAGPGGAGLSNSIDTVTLTNRGTTCFVGGYPSQTFSRQGKTVTVVTTNQSSSYFLQRREDVPVVLHTGEVASVAYSGADVAADGHSCQAIDRVRLSLPGVAPVVVEVGFSDCRGLAVSPVFAGALHTD